MQNKQFVHNQCTASISINGNKIKQYDNNFYLKDGQEFEIELRNLTKDVAAAKIFMNGKAISTSMLVLKPGQRILLKRFLDENKKFLFETYKVDGTYESLKAIEDNGNIEIKFYKERKLQSNTTTVSIPYNQQIYDYTDIINYRTNIRHTPIYGNMYYSSASPTMGGQMSVNSFLTNSSNAECCLDGISKSIETGRIEKGATSNQQFDNYVGNFEYSPFQEIKIKLLPIQYKPTTVSDLVEYCTNCGTKNKKGNYKFCPKCGKKY